MQPNCQDMPDTTSVNVGNDTGVVAVAETESSASGVDCFACSHPGSAAIPPSDKTNVYAMRLDIDVTSCSKLSKSLKLQLLYSGT